MGTSGEYGGGGGREWGIARQQANVFTDDPSDANAEELISDIGHALDWDGDSETPPADGEVPAAPSFTFGPLQARRAAGGGGGGGGGGARGSGRSMSAGTGGRRSRARAATVGGAVTGAGLAYRERDVATLAIFSLTLAELDAASPFDRSKRILEAVGASIGAVDEDELQAASAKALLRQMEEDLSGADSVRAFVVEYVFEIALTEIGDAMRNGTRDGWATVDEEDKLRAMIEVRVEQIEIREDVRGDQIQGAIYKALDDTRTYITAIE